MPIVYAVDWAGFTSDADTGRNRFALTLLREHGIDAIYYALSTRCQRDPAFKDQVRRRVRTLRLTHVPRPADKGLASDGDAIVYRLFLHQGYSGYLTIENIEKRLPGVVARMADAPGRAGGGT